MDPQRYLRIKDIVATALDLPADRVDRYLEEFCGGDPALREEVDALLNVDVGEHFLEQGPVTVREVDEDSEAIPERVGRIRLHRLLARGGMGNVFEGEDELLQRPVAVKVLGSALRMSSSRRAAFLNEAQVLSSLQHPHICQIHDFFEDAGQDVLVLELIRGKTLREVLKQGTVEAPIEMARQIAEAITAAHERGIIHRDLKPDNIMVTDEGVLKVLDFGLARSDETMTSALEEGATNSPRKTQVSGTPGYMSPEQANGQSSTVATDIWSFGLILTELITRKSVYPDGLSSLELMQRTRESDLQIPRSLTRTQSQLIRRMLSATPGKRPSAREVLNEIESWQGIVRRRWVAGLATLALAVMLFGGWKYATDLQQQQMFAEQARQDAEDLAGFMLEDLNKGLVAVGRLDLMESVAQKALGYYGALNPERFQRSRGQPAMALVLIAEVLAGRGEVTQCINVLNQANDALESILRDDPTDDLLAYRYAFVQMKLADYLKIAGQFDLAITHSLRATEMGRALTLGLEPGAGPEEQPNAVDRWRILLRSMYLTADSYMRQGRGDLGVAPLEESVVLAREAAARQSELVIELSNIQFKRCGTYYDLGDRALMLEACESIFELDRISFEAEPDNFLLLKNFGGDHGTLAQVYLKLGRHEKGLALIDDGIKLLRTLIPRELESQETTNELVVLLVARGRLLDAMGRDAESREVFLEAQALITPLIEDQEEITFLNGAFLVEVYLGNLDKARSIAEILRSRNFRRQEFWELCVTHGFADCRANPS